MIRYFIDEIDVNRPKHLPDSPASHTYLNGHCFMEVTNPTDSFLSLNLSEVPANQISSLTNNVFPSPTGVFPS